MKDQQVTQLNPVPSTIALAVQGTISVNQEVQAVQESKLDLDDAEVRTYAEYPEWMFEDFKMEYNVVRLDGLYDYTYIAGNHDRLAFKKSWLNKTKKADLVDLLESLEREPWGGYYFHQSTKKEIIDGWLSCYTLKEVVQIIASNGGCKDWGDQQDRVKAICEMFPSLQCQYVTGNCQGDYALFFYEPDLSPDANTFDIESSGGRDYLTDMMWGSYYRVMLNTEEDPIWEGMESEYMTNAMWAEISTFLTVNDYSASDIELVFQLVKDSDVIY